MPVEIFFEDLKRKKQKEILKELKIKCPEDGNFDVFPIFVYEIEEETIVND
jgi:hypothetical protein